MRYEDTSSSVHGAAGNADARDDADTLANGSNGPASGNVITGAGTTTGKAGADSPSTGHVVAVHGAGGTDSSTDGASLHVDGRYGTLAIDEHGNYKYVADGHAPASFRDLFQYTLADGKGGQSVADLVISRGGEIKVSENAQQIVPGPDGVVTLPAGVDLSDVHVVGRNLVVDMPDGSQIVIVNGAVFVPQLVLGGVEVPSTNLAALLIDSEPRPAAGPPPSSGGDFADPVPPLDPGVPLGDLIPPTVIPYTPPEFHEVNGIIDRKPTIEIQPDGQPASVAAVDSVNEKGLPTRNGGEPAGSGEIADGNGSNNSDTSETHGGTIIIDSQDTPNSVSINGVVVTGVIGQQIAGDFGTLTITGFSGQNILYSYTLNDNTSGDNTHDDFLVTVTDHDGDQASATLVVNIIDDVPTARPDTDTVAAGTYGPETGNVISGVGTTSGSAGADTVGADNAHMTAVTGFGATTAISGGWTVIGHYGVLTIHTDGSYSYVRNPGTPGGVSDVFNYTLTDGDGDTSTTTLTINIGDATPQTGENPLIRFDDDALAGGNPGTPAVGDDSPDTINAAGTLAGSGGDGPLTFAVQTTGAPAGFSYVSGGAGIVLIQQNGHTVLTVTVGANGSYSVVQNAPIDHSAGGQENNQVFTINYTVSDQDNDSAPGTFTINVDDDTPIVGITESQPSLTVDETNLSINASADFSGAFTHSFGADGPAAANSLVYSLGVSAPGADSGLIDVATGQHVLLSVNGSGVVEGRTAVSGDLVFTVSVDSSGNVTLDQVRAVSHPDTSNADDNVTLASSNLITLSLTATDHDGDSASRTLNIGQSLNFHDDGPSVSANAGVQLDDDALSGGNPGGIGDDADSTNTTGTLGHAFGADGAGSIAYLTTGAPAGFSYALQGNGDLWVMQGATHVLTLTVNSSTGAYTVTQVAPIDHPAGSDENNDSFTISYRVTDGDGDHADGSIVVNVDDDTPTVSANAAVQLDDDALAGGNPGGIGDDADSTNTSGTLGHSFGADGAGSIAYLTTGAPAGFTYALQGNGDLWVMQGANHVLTLTVNSSTGAYTVTQVAPIDHAAGSDENNVSFTISYNVTDHDGDSATGSITVNVDDDTPTVSANAAVQLDDDALAGGNPGGIGDDANATNTSGTLGHSFGADGAGSIAYLTTGAPAGFTYALQGNGDLWVMQGANHVLTLTVNSSTGAYTVTQVAPIDHPAGSDENNVSFTISYNVTDHDGDSATGSITVNVDDDTPTVSANAAVQLDDDALAGGNPGGIGDDANATNTSGTLAHSYGADGAGSVAYLTTGAPAGFSYALQGNGDLWVMQGANHVLTLTLNSSTGAYTVTQVAPISHPAGSDENNVSFTISYNVSDHDGDSATGSITVNVDDDTPTANNDTDVTSNITDTADGNVISGVGTTEGAANHDSPGADGFGSITNLVGFNGSSDSNPLGGFSVNGQWGTLQMDANGNYTYTRTGGAGGATDSFTYTYVDGDGDPVSATLTITLADNIPVAGTVNVGLDDDALAGGNAGGIGDDPNSVNATGNLPGSGGDAPLTFGVLLTGAPAGFTYVSGGAGIVLVKQGATTVLTITVDSTTGAYSVVQNAPIVHAAGSDENNQAFTITYTVTDQDTDVANGTINISVDDDTPTVSANAGVQLDDDALAGGNAGGIGDDANATNTSGTLAHSYGADGAGSVAYLTTGAPAGFSYVLQGNGDLWVMQGATHVLTLTVNSSTGAYTVSQVAPIDHAAGGDENNQSFTISYRVTDGDGDTVDGSISVNVDDDTPTVSANAAVQLDDDALAGGNAGGTGDVNPDTANTSGTLGHSFGADGAGSMAYLTTGAPAGFTYALQGNGDLWIMQGANHVITLTLNSSTGAYTVTQVAPIDHAAGSDENDVSFTVSYNVTDHDGDSATGSIVINVDDDTPTVSANAAVQLDDDALAGGNAGGTGDVNPDTANTSGTLGHSFGADGAGSMAYLTTGAPAGFTYALQGNGDLWIMQGANHVVTLTLNSSTGAYTVTQVAPIDHPAGSNENDVAFTISYNVTDHDGDTATGSIVVNVDDDTPTVSANAAVQLDDDALAGGNPGGTGDVNPDTANLTGTLAHSYGADGAGSVALLGTGAPAGFTYDTSTPGTLLIKQGATTVITVTVNSSTGAYTVVQNAPIAHAAGGDENDVAFTVSYNVSDHDGDTATGSIVINVDDDTPTATIVATGANTSLDESVGVQIDSNDTTSASVIALFSGVTAPVGTDTDLPQYATNASAIVASTGSSYGADGAGTTTYSLNVSGAGVDSGLNTTDGHDILLFKEGNLIVGRVSGGADNGKAAFAIAIDNTGHISTVEYLSIQHPDGTNPDDMVSIANGAVTATVTLTDSDGDAVSSTPLGIGSHIQFQDSGPVMTAAQNINIQNSGTVSNSGQFAFNLGADGPNITTNDVITNVTGSATVNGVAVQNWTLTPGAEDATTASYSFSFDYGVGGGSTAHETGTLVFDKIAGTYTVDLANPIQGVTTILQTATGTLFQGYEPGTSTVDGSQPAISVTQIQDLAGTANDIYVQFTSVAEPSSGTGDNNLEFSNWVPGADNPAPHPGAGDDTAWNAGQLFNQVDSWVSTSNSSNGVAGDTIQGGEVLDFSLVQGANPTGILAAPSTYAQASAMFLKFDGIGSSEDMIVVLKLYDPTTNSYTTRAIMIENSDIIKGPGSGPGTYSGISLDNNDGLVIIESNDYNGAGEHWVIVGAQIAGSDEGLTGNAINLNGAIGAGGGSNTTGSFQPFSTDASDGPFKISSIGFTTVQTTAQPAHLDFNVTVTDGDGDSITQAIAVDVTTAANSASAATIPAGNTTVAAAPLPTKSTAAVADAYPTTQHSDAQQTTTNSNAVLVGALAAAGLAGADSVAASTLHVDLNSSVSSIATVSYHAQNLAPISIDAVGGHSLGDLMPSLSSGGFAGPIAQAPHFGDQGDAHVLSLAGVPAAHSQAPTQLVQAMQAPAHDGPAFATAASIAMPAAQQLAGVAGGVGGAQHNQVVGQILADALHGGGSQPNIDGMLSALPGQAGHGYGVALASGFGSAVSNGDSHGFGDFTGASAGFTMEHMMIIHQAAALAHG